MKVNKVRKRLTDSLYYTVSFLAAKQALYLNVGNRLIGEHLPFFVLADKMRYLLLECRYLSINQSISQLNSQSLDQ